MMQDVAAGERGTQPGKAGRRDETPCVGQLRPGPAACALLASFTWG